jgi:hypothetical protein
LFNLGRVVWVLRFLGCGRTISARSVGERSPILALGAEAGSSSGGLIAGATVAAGAAHSGRAEGDFDRAFFAGRSAEKGDAHRRSAATAATGAAATAGSAGATGAGSAAHSLAALNAACHSGLACIPGATGTAVARADGDVFEREAGVDGNDSEAAAAALSGLTNVATTAACTAAAAGRAGSQHAGGAQVGSATAAAALARGAGGLAGEAGGVEEAGGRERAEIGGEGSGAGQAG